MATGSAEGGGVLLANSTLGSAEVERSVWEEPEALVDVAFTAGVLGLVAGLLVVVRLSATRFPDTLFWQALPLLLTLPPAMFLGALCAPGGGVFDVPVSGRGLGSRLALSGLLSYLAPLVVLSLAAAVGAHH
jgi:hypothetical protein